MLIHGAHKHIVGLIDRARDGRAADVGLRDGSTGHERLADEQSHGITIG